MTNTSSFDREIQKSFSRLIPRVEITLKNLIEADPQGWAIWKRRLDIYFPALFRLYIHLYGGRYDFFFHLEDLLVSLGKAWFERPEDLRKLDLQREANPLWFHSNQMLGGVCYVDLFAGNLEGVRSKIAYFQELGLTYLHLMPLFKAPDGENDGGYAVSSYREVNPSLGNMQQLASLTRDFRQAGISLVVDLVFNHTSNEHVWAQRAKAGETDFQDFYFIFTDRSMPDQYERTLREIFPDEHSGTFTYYPDMPTSEYGHAASHGAWVWTTFHSYQWDLNYGNPAVFNRMVEEMLFLANQGVEIIRLDAVAFIWKQMGTNCENLPEAHQLIRAFNLAARIAAPAMLFKSEAIVHPDEVAKYIDPEECQLSYNPLLMALLWNTLATREVKLLEQAMAKRYSMDEGCAWVNYVRCHDDIGWTFSDKDAAFLGVNGSDHRRFLNEFYRGKFPGSFARGLPFQENPKTGDCRISGTCASLAGLEKALAEEGPYEVELAIRRILLIHGLVMVAGGIPLIYLGDEIGVLNDYTYHDNPDHERDSRWVHRPAANWEQIARRKDGNTLEGRVYQGLMQLVALRKSHAVFCVGGLEVVPTQNAHVLGLLRTSDGSRVVILGNFSEREQLIPPQVVEQIHGLAGAQILHGEPDQMLDGSMLLKPFELLVLG